MTTTTQPQDALREAARTIRELRAQVAQARPSAQPVAIVGMAFRLPGGVTDPEAYWELLMRGEGAVSQVPDWRWAGRPPRVTGGDYAGTVDDVDQFDPEYFRISPSDAETMDPQQRLVLHVANEALQRWGRLPDDLDKSSTGVFIGAGHQDHLSALTSSGTPVRASTGTGNARSIIANRVSYTFGLQGPSLVLDTACSSSLVAVHAAAQSLQSGDCDAALAGGVNLILAPESTHLTGRALPLAHDGQTRTFDAAAEGMVRGEGAALVVLRRLQDAVRDGDHIHAVILGSGVNQDGKTNGLTAPNPASQSALLGRVLAQTGIDRSRVTYIETHGTGTPLGDPIEADGIAQVYAGRPGDPPCWLGSVKPVIGHLESAAGVASLIKAVLALEHEVIPAQINLHSLNSEVEGALRGTRLDVVREHTAWSNPDRVAGVSSFGFGGTNAHALLAPAPQAKASPQVGGAEAWPVLVPASGHTSRAADDFSSKVVTYLRNHPDRTHHAAATLAGRRVEERFRRPVIVPDRGADPQPIRARRESLAGRTALIFGGQGTTWRQDVLRDPAVADVARQWGIDEVLTSAVARPESWSDTRIGQKCVAAMEAAIASELAGHGLHVDAVIGHSLGEVVAATFTGHVSSAEAVALIEARSQVQHERAYGGSMVAIADTEESVHEALKASGCDDVSIAAVNSSRSVVVAGPHESIERFLRGLDGTRVKHLETSYAFHSPALRSGALTLPAVTSDAIARADLYSTVTGARVLDRPSSSHWIENVASPVRFADAVRAAVLEGVTRFVDVSPQPSLRTHVLRIAEAEGKDVEVIDVVADGAPLRDCVARAVAQAWAAGATVDFAESLPKCDPLPSVPTSVFDTRPFWLPDSTAVQTGPERDQPTRVDAGTLLRELTEIIAEVADFDSADQVLTDVPTTDLDVDSAQFVEIKNRVEDLLEVAVPLTLLLEGTSLDEIAAALSADDQAPAHPAPEDLLAGRDLESLTEEEIDELLAIHETGEPA